MPRLVGSRSNVDQCGCCWFSGCVLLLAFELECSELGASSFQPLAVAFIDQWGSVDATCFVNDMRIYRYGLRWSTPAAVQDFGSGIELDALVLGVVDEVEQTIERHAGELARTIH
jgi:hypothetical protein